MKWETLRLARAKRPPLSQILFEGGNFLSLKISAHADTGFFAGFPYSSA
jgi:hypothetical protein